MAGKKYAQTEIRVGKEGGEVDVIAEGDAVTGFDAEQMEHWEEIGVVADVPPKYDEVSTDAEIRARDERIDELEKALAEAQKK